MADAQADSVALPPGLNARAAARAATIAELSAQTPEGAPATPEPEPAPESEPAEPTAEPEPEAPAEPEAEPEPQAEPPPPSDPDTERRIAAVQKAEKRSKELLAKEREELGRVKTELERERREWQAELEEFKQLKARARYAPAEVLAKLGLVDDDMEPAARDLYARSKAAQQNPQAREAAVRMQREREYVDKVERLERELTEFREQAQKQAQQAQYENAWQTYYTDVTNTVNGETPLLKNALTKNPRKTQQVIRDVATAIAQETGEWPDPQDVITAYEQQRRAELEELGVPWQAAVTKSKAVAPAEPPPRTLAADMAASTPVPKAAKSRADHRAETIRLMQTGKVQTTP